MVVLAFYLATSMKKSFSSSDAKMQGADELPTSCGQITSTTEKIENAANDLSLKEDMAKAVPSDPITTDLTLTNVGYIEEEVKELPPLVMVPRLNSLAVNDGTDALFDPELAEFEHQLESDSLNVTKCKIKPQISNDWVKSLRERLEQARTTVKPEAKSSTQPKIHSKNAQLICL
jgi:hypothetical protein